MTLLWTDVILSLWSFSFPRATKGVPLSYLRHLIWLDEVPKYPALYLIANVSLSGQFHRVFSLRTTIEALGPRICFY